MIFYTKRRQYSVHCGQKICPGIVTMIIILIELCLKNSTVMGFTTCPLVPSFREQLSMRFTTSSTSLSFHHTALKTRNITTAIEFYSLFGYQVACRFRAGPARAAWLEVKSPSDPHNITKSARLELIEVPGYILQEEPGTRARAIDLMQRPELLGYNHLALDVTQQINDHDGIHALGDWLGQLNRTSMKESQRSLRIALSPRQQIIGRSVYELAFVYDADGSLIELVHKQGELSKEIESGWEPWDGEGFVGDR